MSEKNNNNINNDLEKSLEAFRVIALPASGSWKQHYATEEFSKPSLLDCPQNEQDRFVKRLLECPITIQPSIKMPAGTIVSPSTLLDLVNILKDPNNKGIKKENRKVVFSTSNGERPAGDRAYLIWNGFQCIDMDIKDKKLAKALKDHIFKTLHKCNWFLGVTFSASGKGLHVYTKIAVPIDSDDSIDIKKKKLLYFTNFRHKFSFVYIACLSAMESLGFSKDDLQRWMDISMFKPAQGAFLGYDSKPLISTNFFEDFIYICFDNVEDMGHPDIDWVSHPDLKVIFSRWQWFEDSLGDAPKIELLSDTSESAPLEILDNKIHYKHEERWKMANTLVNIFGLADAIKYMRSIMSSKVCDREIIADCQTAARHSKPINIWAVNRLNNTHGFRIKLDVDSIDIGESELMSAMDNVPNPNAILRSKYYYRFDINKKQYLGNILDEIISKTSRLSLIEAGPGLGKTEMVKQLVNKGKKVMMILPFTSVIKSKVESEEGWYYSYGSRKPRLDIQKGLALTVDKFSRLNNMDIKAAGFDYIFLDESHLLFMSEYRPVMPKVIEMIRNTEVPIILMSGTPTGELVFFPDIVHIHVIKEETRKKELEVNLVENPSAVMFSMCRSMANDIASQRRVLFPTNAGTLFSKRIQAGVEYFLRLDHAIYEPINLKYYKKSNVGEDFMDDINFKKSIKNINILMGSAYMSCGLDILDKYNFQIYFADLMTAAECDQYCNRLRNNDLFIKTYIAKNDAEGNSRNVHKFRPINFKLDDDEIRNVHSILRICNDMIERNPEETKYNNIVGSILKDNRYITKDELSGKFYINEIAYKTNIFEQKYRDYAEQLPVYMKGMASYGYNVTAKDLGNFSSNGTEIFADLKNMIKLAADEQISLNKIHIEELLDLITEDRLGLYKSVIEGKYEIRKAASWREDEDKMIMYVKNIEVFEKVIPIFVSMSRRFEINTIKDIFEYCKTEKRGYNFSAIQRVRTLINIVENAEQKNLDLPIVRFMNDSYEFTENNKVVSKIELNKFIADFVTTYAEQSSTVEILINNSVLTIKKLNEIFLKIFKCLINVGRPSKGMVTLTKHELLWQKKESFFDIQTANLVSGSYELTGFIDAMIPITDITYNFQNQQDRRMIENMDDTEFEELVEETKSSNIEASDEDLLYELPF